MEQKIKLKEEIKKKIENAEIERKNLEKLLAQVEKQEMEILKCLKKNPKHNRLNSMSSHLAK